MQTASNNFVNALRWGTTLVAARLTVLVNGTKTAVVLPVSSGVFTVDRNSVHRRSGQITVEILPTVPPQKVFLNGTALGLLPLSPTALLAPFGTEVFVEVSVVGPGGLAGANGWIPLGLFAIATTDVQDTGNNLTITLDLFDRSWSVAQRKLLTAYTVPASDGSLQGELTALLNTAWGSTAPPWTYSVIPGSYTVPAGTYNQGQDPWQAALDFFTSAGYELFFDVNGNVVGKPVPTPKSQPIVWNFVEGEVSAQGTFAHTLGGTPYTTPVDASVTMTRDGIPNNFYVGASGPNNANGTNTPVQANAADNNPQSATFIGGGMGNVPDFLFDSLITTAAQAQAEAQYRLTTALSKAWTVSVSTPLNPLFDIDDACTLTRSRLGLNAQPFIVDTITTHIHYAVLTTITGRMIT